MIYSNLIYLLVVMVLLAINSPSAGLSIPSYQIVALFILKAWLFWQLVNGYQRFKVIKRLTEYFSAERILSLAALLLFGIDLYFLDLRYYLKLLPFSQQIPSLVIMSGVGVFLFYLVLLWLQLQRSYEEAVGVRKNPYRHVQEKLKICIAIILPWLAVNLLHDLLLLAPSATIQQMMASSWGEAVFLLLVLVGLAICFPLVLVRLFGCTPLPPGPGRRHIEEFCRQLGVRFGGIYLWPLVEGKVLTAGVVGLFGSYRYLLITPGLLAALSQEELDGVIAHEIGHVKKQHLGLYLLLFLGLAAVLQVCLPPLIVQLFSTRAFYEFLFAYEGEPGFLLEILTTIPLIILLLLYCRYVFGFFMRNFERQADHYSYLVLGSAAPLVRVFKKIGLLSGNGRDIPCWHHFSIGQRIDYLSSCQADAGRAKLHDMKVYAGLAGYFVVVAMALILTLTVAEQLKVSYSGQLVAQDVILEKIEQDPGNPLWHHFHGDLLVARQQYAAAITAFELSLRLYPDNPEVLNNLAWLLLTVENRKIVDLARALKLAEKAVEIQARSHILDTLAEAYWLNGMVDLAIETEQRALAESSGNKEYYRQQLKRFSLKTKS